MRLSDVNDVIVPRHVGGVSSVNKEWVRMQKSENSYSLTVHFDWCNSTHNSLQAQVRLRRYTAVTQYNSNMAAFTIADRMTSLSTHV